MAFIKKTRESLGEDVDRRYLCALLVGMFIGAATIEIPQKN